MDIQIDGQKNSEVDTPVFRYTAKYIVRQKDTHTDRQRDRQRNN